jgi:hypothetical protein
MLHVIVGLAAVVQVALWLWQPMFHNQLVMRDGFPFMFWWPEAAYEDSRGNLAKADFPRNLLVVFLSANRRLDPAQFYLPRFVRGGVAFPSQLTEKDELEFVVPNTRHRLFVFGTDGTRSDFPLEFGEAERIGKLMRAYPRPLDLVELLDQAYAEKHSAKQSGNLRKVLGTFEMKTSHLPTETCDGTIQEVASGLSRRGFRGDTGEGLIQ